MILLFPSFPFDVRRVDPGFEVEERAAREAGFKTAYVDVELNSAEEPAFCRLGVGEPSEVLYRGWLITPAVYARIEVAVCDRGHRLATSSEAYLESYEFPRWYEKLRDHTPRSFVYIDSDFDEATITRAAVGVAQEFGNRSVIVKDFLKSRKHEWWDACFIQRADDVTEVKRVVTNFVAGQGANLAGGLVFREFIDFERAGMHPKSQMPLIQEWRVFVWQHEVLYVAPYWASEDYAAHPDIPANWLSEVITKLTSRFFVLDVAKRLDGTWMVMEVNDAGAAGIPEGGSAPEFYGELARQIAGT